MPQAQQFVIARLAPPEKRKAPKASATRKAKARVGEGVGFVAKIWACCQAGCKHTDIVISLSPDVCRD